MSELLADLRQEFRKYKSQAERAMSQLSDDQFYARPGELVNPIALIVKHLAGNFASRWTDFLATDGEKPWRNRDSEFVLVESDTRASLMVAWERSWSILLQSVDSLREADLSRKIRIRNEEMTAQQAIVRALTHVAYHVGQITYLMRLLRPEGEWLTIAPGQSRQHVAEYTKPA